MPIRPWRACPVRNATTISTSWGWSCFNKPAKRSIFSSRRVVSAIRREVSTIAASRILPEPPAVHWTAVEKFLGCHDAVALKHDAILHHERNVAEGVDVFQRIAPHGNQV